MTGGLDLLFSALKMITSGAGAPLLLVGFSPWAKKPKVYRLCLSPKVKRREGFWRSQTNHRSFDDGSFCSLSSRTLLFLSPKVQALPKPKVNSRKEARLSLTSCEARRIIDPLTMGSSLFDAVGERVSRSETNRRSFDDGLVSL